jgi:hypothetical protein
MGWAKVGTGATLAAFGALAGRYAVQRQRLEGSWLRAVGPKVSAIGEVEHLSVLPLVERLVPGDELEGEPGVSLAGGCDTRPRSVPPGPRRATGETDPPAGGDGHEALA